MTTGGKSRIQVIHFLSCGKRSGSTNSIVTGTTKKGSSSVRGCPATGNFAPRRHSVRDTEYSLMSSCSLSH